MKDVATNISMNEQIAGDIYRARFPIDWKSFDPGQFVMVSIPGKSVFLRRPFGIVRVEKGEAEICYKVVGKGTKGLSQVSVGASIDVLGPCGHGFVVPRTFGTALLVAGGYGIAPLFGMALKLSRAKKPAVIYYGAKDKGHLLYIDELKKMGVTVKIATEDGSKGAKGTVIELFKKEIAAIDKPLILSCGPKGLIKTVAEIGRKLNIPTQISMEEYMACGLGVCLGCACKNSVGSYVRVCREGPVFDTKDLRLEI